MMRPPPPPAVAGHGSPVVLLHGVGFDGRVFDPLVPRLAPARTVVVPARRGYGPGLPEPPGSLLDQVEDVVAVADRMGLGRVELVGVGGGATVALLAGATHPDRFHRIVAHEPLIGPRAGHLHHAVADAADRLARTPAATPDAGVRRFVRDQVGPVTWSRIDPVLRHDLDRVAATVRAEVPLLTGFDPSDRSLGRLRGLDLLVTVGSRSPLARQRAAGILALVAGGSVRVVPDCDHLAPIDAPDHFAAVVRRAVVGRQVATAAAR
jgi:pimeloyl-ACP methyl ester carboxylesterase